MSSQTNYLKQNSRFAVFFLNAATFYAIYVWSTGDWNIAGNGQNIWFLSAVAWWTLSLISAPWYRPPRDAIGSALAIILTLAPLDMSAVVNPSLAPVLEIAYWGAWAYASILGICSLIAVFLEFGGNYEAVRRTSFFLANTLSKGSALYGVVAYISIFGFYSDQAKSFFIAFLWLLFALLNPYEIILKIFWKFKNHDNSFTGQGSVGKVRRVDDPNILRVSISQPNLWDEAAIYVAVLAGEKLRYAFPLFIQTQGDELVGTMLCGDAYVEELSNAEIGDVLRLDHDPKASELLARLSGGDDKVEIVGFVVEDSSIGAIKFEVSKDSSLEEGAVVFCNLPSGRVYYQILDAQTSEESFKQNPRGTHIALAAQLGTLDASHCFQKFSWLPSMNCPVFRLLDNLTEIAEVPSGSFVVGKVPSTNIGLRVNLSELLEYHCAILGMTGTGKTELALDVVREAVANGCKVFCVDLTGEYKVRLQDLAPKEIGISHEEAEGLEKKLFDVETGTFGAPTEKKVLKEFIDGIEMNVRDRVSSFLESETDFLAVHELEEVTNTRATLRITELFLSEIMRWARCHRKAKRILIVLEEAHTIIPEINSSGFDRDTQWVVGKIGQIALQGRKYGVGLLVVSQRTALVSKTILSQCNTYFTHSLVDQTSLSYLGNIYSPEHVRCIPNLRFLEALVCGKAVKSDRPMLIKRDFDPQKEAASQALDFAADSREQ